MGCVMWVQKAVNSKLIKILLIAMVLVFSFGASTSHAVGLDTAVKIVAGSNAQKVVRAIGEKAGMAFTPKSLQATTDYINGQASRGNAKYIDLAKKVNTVGGSGVPDTTKTGWKKYVLDPVLWLTGADLLVEAYDAFNDAQATGSSVPMYGDDGSGGSKCYPVAQEDATTKLYLTHQELSTPMQVAIINTAEKPTCKSTEWEVLTPTSIRVYFTIYKNGSPYNQTYANITVLDSSRYAGGYEYERNSSDDDEFDISNVTNADTYRTTIDSDDDYTKVTYDNDIEIYAPDETNTTETNNYLTPWNPKMSDDEFTLIVQPIQDVDVVVPGDDDDLPTGPRPDPVEVIDRSMLDVAVKTYDYLADSVDTTILAMRDITDSAGNIVGFLDTTMDWLPSEWRAVFTSAFVLGVFAHFMRR